MVWLLSFVFSWILFFLTTDKKKLKSTFWCGVLTVILAIIVDGENQRLNLYQFKNLILSIYNNSIFYLFGPIFTMGVVFSQYVPRKKLFQILHIFVFSLVFLALEYLVIKAGSAIQIHWSYLNSMMVNFLTLSFITWVTQNFLN